MAGNRIKGLSRGPTGQPRVVHATGRRTDASHPSRSVLTTRAAHSDRPTLSRHDSLTKVLQHVIDTRGPIRHWSFGYAHPPRVPPIAEASFGRDIIPALAVTHGVRHFVVESFYEDTPERFWEWVREQTHFPTRTTLDQDALTIGVRSALHELEYGTIAPAQVDPYFLCAYLYTRAPGRYYVMEAVQRLAQDEGIRVMVYGAKPSLAVTARMGQQGITIDEQVETFRPHETITRNLIQRSRGLLRGGYAVATLNGAWHNYDPLRTPRGLIPDEVISDDVSIIPALAHEFGADVLFNAYLVVPEAEAVLHDQGPMPEYSPYIHQVARHGRPNSFALLQRHDDPWAHIVYPNNYDRNVIRPSDIQQLTADYLQSPTVTMPETIDIQTKPGIHMHVEAPLAHLQKESEHLILNTCTWLLDANPTLAPLFSASGHVAMNFFVSAHIAAALPAYGLPPDEHIDRSPIYTVYRAAREAPGLYVFDINVSGDFIEESRTDLGNAIAGIAEQLASIANFMAGATAISPREAHLATVRRAIQLLEQTADYIRTYEGLRPDERHTAVEHFLAAAKASHQQHQLQIEQRPVEH